MAEAVRDLEAAGEGAILRGPTIYDRLRETVELMGDTPARAKRGKRARE